MLLVNRRNARFFVGDDRGLEETDRVEDDVHSQHDQGGWSQSRYQRGVEKEKDDHLVHVADVAFGATRSAGSTGCWSAPPRSSSASSSRSCTRTCASGSPAACTSTSRTPPSTTCVRAAAAAIEDWRRRLEREALDRLVEGVGRGGRGAAGLAAVLQALNEQRVETLLVADGYRSPGGREPEHRHAARGRPRAGRRGARALREHRRAGDREGDRAVCAKVIKVRYHDDLGPLGGIGAVLRY